jgi:hypothetical protein
MILGVPDPIENGPGHEGFANTALGAMYNKQVQCKTVLYAMLYWFTSKAVDIVWKEISATYWKHRGKDVLAALRHSARNNEFLRAYDEDGPYTYIPNSPNSLYVPRRRTGREIDLVAMLEKHLSSAGSRGLVDQGPGK